MIAANFELGAEARAELRRRYATAPGEVGRSADECADLTIHAIEQAVATIQMITDRAPPQTRLVVFATTLGLAAATLKELDKTMTGMLLDRVLAAGSAKP